MVGSGRYDILRDCRYLFILFLMLSAVLIFSSDSWAARISDAAAEAPPSGQGSGPTVKIDFRDVDIRVVAKFISEVTGKNIVFDKQVRDKVTLFSPTAVTPDEAYKLFETVLKINGYTTVPKNGLIMVMPSQEARTSDVETRHKVTEKSRGREDRVVTQLIRLENADAQEMQALLQPLMPKTGSLLAYPGGNTLIVTDYASNIDRLISIIQTVDVPDEGTQLTVIPLKNASAKEVAKELQEILRAPPAQGKRQSGARLTYQVVPDERTNTLIVMARASETRTIRQLAAELDKPSLRGSDRIHVVFLKNAVAEELAETINELTGQVSAKGKGEVKGAPKPLLLQEQVVITADKATNALIIRAERQDFLVLQNIIDKLDIVRAQVLVEGVIMEMTVEKANDLGAEWRVLEKPKDNEWTTFGGTASGDGDASRINQATVNPLSSTGGLILGAARGTITWGGTTFLNIGALIHAMETDDDVNILATPHILTMDNEEASIIVGEERPFLKSSMTAATGAVTPSVTNTYEFKDLGLTLKITPHITQGDNIKLKIFQELKSFKGESETGAITSTKRETETTVQVKDGETVVISGLIEDQQRENKSAVPCFGSLPGVGWAFKSRTQSSGKVNLLVLIRPTIIRSPAKLEEMTRKKRRESEAQTELEDYRHRGQEYPQRGVEIFKDE